MTTIKVANFQTDVQMPEPQRGRNSSLLRERFPFETMPVGASFFIPGASQKICNTVLRAAKSVGAKAAGRMAIEGGLKGVRFWRIA